MTFQSNIRHGRNFERQEKSEWTYLPDNRRSYEHIIPLYEKPSARGRIDVLIRENDGSISLIEIKATNWDKIRPHRVKPNVQRHARQVWKYALHFWAEGIDVCPALVYPHAPSDSNRRHFIEGLLEERWVQVVWSDERSDDRPGNPNA